MLSAYIPADTRDIPTDSIDIRTYMIDIRTWIADMQQDCFVDGTVGLTSSCVSLD